MRKLLTWSDRYHWLWLTLAAPLMLFPSPKRSLAMLVVPGIWAVAWLVSRHPERKSGGTLLGTVPLPVTALNSSILLIAIMVLVSTWATYDIAFSLAKISGIVLGLGIFYAVVRESERPRGWWWSLLLFLGLGMGVAGLGLLGTNWFQWKISLFNPITSRIPNLVGGLQGAENGFHPNEIAGALSWTLPLMMTLCFSPLLKIRSGRWVVRAIIWLSTLFMGGVFILTQSRTAYLALASAALVMFWLALPGKARWALIGLLVAVGVAGSIWLSGERITQGMDWLTGNAVLSEQAFSLNSLESRLEVWSRAIYGLQDFPFTGMGMNTFREVVHVLYPLFMIAPDVDMGHAHNEFLQAGLDLGIPGMIGFIALYIGAFWMLARVWFAGHRSSVLSRPMALGLGGGLFAHMLYGMTDAVALGAKPGFLFWMLLGLIAGLYQQVLSASVEQ
ncbi:MAG: O-antigen ligase family protein [Chloroflexi bacterium]|nr:O-antigen ligase family protein [Chloroflexota bacterium]